MAGLSNLKPPDVDVIRGGATASIDPDYLMVGDVVLLKADMRVIDGVVGDQESKGFVAFDENSQCLYSFAINKSAVSDEDRFKSLMQSGQFSQAATLAAAPGVEFFSSCFFFILQCFCFLFVELVFYFFCFYFLFLSGITTRRSSRNGIRKGNGESSTWRFILLQTTNQ